MTEDDFPSNEIDDERVSGLQDANGGPWGSHPRFPRTSWQRDVARKMTSSSYWVWLARKIDDHPGIEAPAGPATMISTDGFTEDEVIALQEANGGPDGSHPDFPREDWDYEVANGDTSRGYWLWVACNMQQDVPGDDDENAPKTGC